ncbi:unnamed protein product [Didymodactylos carnosus]|uniref:GRAM domain-containing protein n=1 Tax=Didymodactylos carnosus TaxID=1234261 RepID=A0A815VV34_9BILA|nr:unnamed protein product [Didymodactylos carnosus]CAF1539862.1 unnamed protein product [Didymodactylos carnosus]CAF3533803.1 unnamed protein product [Didymodactylos carnosus]CAF4400116.1 unnamed protein product [Didymodactylos carnosus]
MSIRSVGITSMNRNDETKLTKGSQLNTNSLALNPQQLQNYDRSSPSFDAGTNSINKNNNRQSQSKELLDSLSDKSDSDDLSPSEEEGKDFRQIGGQYLPELRASARQRKQFQKLFLKEISDMPELIDHYVCAYQGDILLQGKMYMTDKYLCFHSRIIAYVTKHVYRWDQIENVTKERVAFIFPTAIGIQIKETGKKVIYASFLMRDAAYDTILQLWNTYLENESTREDTEDENGTKNSTLKAQPCTCYNVNGNKRENALTSSYNERVDGNSLTNKDDRLVDDVIQRCIDQEEKTKQAEQDKLFKKNNQQERQPSVTSKSSDEKQQQKKRRKLKDVSINLKMHTDAAADTDRLIIKAPAEHLCGRHPDVKQQNYKQKSISHKTDSKKHPQHPDRIRKLHRTRSASTHRQLLDKNVSNQRIKNHSQNRSVTPEPMTNIENDNTTTTDNDSVLLFPPSLNSSTVITQENSLTERILKKFLLMINRLKSYSFRTSLAFLIFIILLFFHSLYLIRLAYRIENRLHALRHIWPTPSSSTVKPNIPSAAQMGYKDI